MDDLLSILIMIGIAGISIWRKQNKQAKQAAKNAQRKRAFSDLEELEKKASPAVSKKEVLEQLKEQLQEASSGKAASAQGMEKKSAQRSAAKAEYAQEKPSAMQMKMELPQEKPSAPKQLMPVARPALKAKPAPLLYMDDEPEGTVSTQGESPREHALHRQRIFDREEKIRSEYEELEEIRNMNLKKLRTAVVMSEILDKPVSLRRRIY